MNKSSIKISRKIKVGKKNIGPEEPVFIIAEIGNNHNGDLNLAKKLIMEAAWIGADAVKFQKRILSEVFIQDMLAKPQTSSRALGSTYGEYRQKLEFDERQLKELKNLAHSLGLVFFVTPFDLKSAAMLNNIKMDAWKIASFDTTHLPLMEYVAQRKQPIFLSTGMASMEEIKEAVDLILKYNDQLVINHCVSVYPTPDEDLNLGAVETLIKEFPQFPIGYSGHEIGFMPSVVAVSLGAKVIERHFTMDKSLPGPDHSTVSLDLAEFSEMIRQIRRIEKAIADKKIYLHEKEIPHRHKHGKSLVARTAIPAGAKITAKMVCCKSPGYGMKTGMMKKLIGKKAKVDIPIDTVIKEEDIKW